MSSKTKSAGHPRGSPSPPTCERLWTAEELSEFLGGVPIATLYQWRYLGIGPVAFRVGKRLRYDPDEVRRWLVESCRGAL
jgi:Helix-turn-helix domain